MVNSSDSPKPRIARIGRKQHGVAGQYGYLATVIYGDDVHEILFSTNGYGGPFFAGQVRIDAAVVERCGGVLNPSFIRKFYPQEGSK